MATTNEDFIAEKKANFSKWLKSIIHKYCKGEVLKTSMNKLSELDNVNAVDFASWIVLELVPYERNIPAFVERMLDGTSVKMTELQPAELDKFNRYVECFIAIVKQP